MRIEEIVEAVEALGGVLTLRPQPGDGSPEISRGDLFCYYAPDGVLPRTQPFATIVTKDHPGDEGSRLDRPGAFRLNVAAGSAGFRRWTGRDPRQPATDDPDPSTPDRVIAHPRLRRAGLAGGRRPGPAHRVDRPGPAPDRPPRRPHPP
jgi:hypothetical protein